MWLKIAVICAVVNLVIFANVGAAFQARIVNGTDAMAGEFPFIVSLRRISSGRHSCGASLINHAWVLTAAHCVARALPTMLNIQYGSSTINPNITDHLVNVSKIFAHEGYAPNNQYEHDIALLKLAEPISFTDDVQAVRLPESRQITPENETAILIGWGLNAVSLRHASTGAHFCAGTIIDTSWVLTAAHCFAYIKMPSELFEQYGNIELNPKSSERENVTAILQHEGYNPTIAINDVALLKLEQPLSYTQDVKATKLPKTDMQVFASNKKVKLLGWGLNKTFGSLQTILQQVELQLLNLTECSQQLSSFIHESNLCAAGLASVKSQCSGDSGGPLILDDIQVGIVSWSLKPCATKPGVFTNVTFYINWLQEQQSLYN